MEIPEERDFKEFEQILVKKAYVLNNNSNEALDLIDSTLESIAEWITDKWAAELVNSVLVLENW